MNCEVEIFMTKWLRPGITQDGLMKIVQINGRPVHSKWARILIRFMDFRGLRLQTDLSLPCGNPWIWEFQVGTEYEPYQIKGIMVRQTGAMDPDLPYEYEVRFIMDEQHPFIVRMKEGYSGQQRETPAQEELKLDLFG